MLDTILIAVVITSAVLAVNGAMTTVGMWYRRLRKPRWNPPDWVFGPAWGVILGLATWAGVLAWLHAPDAAARWRVGILFGCNIALQVSWSPLFFNLKRPDWALIEVAFLWASILAMIIGVGPLSLLAAWLLVPYLAWVSFAAFLNLTIVRMNAPFGAAKRAGTSVR
jgi:tryptophan-rich sensory protein